LQFDQFRLQPKKLPKVFLAVERGGMLLSVDSPNLVGQGRIGQLKLVLFGGTVF
jgi:hypothetical protein